VIFYRFEQAITDNIAGHNQKSHLPWLYLTKIIFAKYHTPFIVLLKAVSKKISIPNGAFLFFQMEQLSNKLQAAVFPLSIFQNIMQPDTCNDHIIKIALTSEHNHTVLVLTHCCYVINTNIALHKPSKEAKVAKVQFGEAALMFFIDDLSREPVSIN